MNLIKLDQFRKEYFAPGSQPDIRTLKKYINEGALPGKKIGKLYYVDTDSLEFTGDDLVDRVLVAS